MYKIFSLAQIFFFIVNFHVSFAEEKCNFNCNSQKSESNVKKNKGNRNIKITLPETNIESSECTKIRTSLKSNIKDLELICDNEYGYIISNTLPSHLMMIGITSPNEQVPIPAINYISPIKLKPKKSKKFILRDAALGVAINGVPIYDYTSKGEIDLYNYNSKKDTYALGQLDKCGGHAGRGDDYHYHIKPKCMIENIKNYTPKTIIGWAFDGYPIFGYKDLSGTEIDKNELDQCNGMNDPIFGYRYHTSNNEPYILKCLVGEVDVNILPKVSPLKGSNIRKDLKPPKGKVKNLKLTKEGKGSFIMDYEYNNIIYYISYKQSNNGNCYNFIQKTISNNKLEEAILCR